MLMNRLFNGENEQLQGMYAIHKNKFHQNALKRNTDLPPISKPKSNFSKQKIYFGEPEDHIQQDCKQDSDPFKDLESSIKVSDESVGFHMNRIPNNFKDNMMSSNGFALMNHSNTEKSEDEYVYSHFEQEILKMNSKNRNLKDYNPEIENSSLYEKYDDNDSSQQSEPKFSF